MKKTLLLLCILTTSQLKAQTYNGCGGNISDDNQPNYFFINVSGLTPSPLNATHGLISVCLSAGRLPHDGVR